MSGPPIPSFIFRGHSSAIHALHFFSLNKYLASGDSEGWIVIWNLSKKRAEGVWKGHDGNILGIKDWQDERLISHGRDHKLRVWQIRPQDLESLSKQLPVEGAKTETVQPWLIHSMDINALNFCAFSMYEDTTSSVLIATPNGLDQGQVDIFQLPSQQRIHTVSPTPKDSAMVMAVSLFNSNDKLTLISGHEDGIVAVLVWTDASVWKKIFTSTPHKQPILSIDINSNTFITSGADALIAKFRIQSEQVELEKSANTKHAGQQDLKIRSDSKIFATAGWDKMVRIYSVKTLKELAVLQWHQEGCYSIDFAKVQEPRTFSDTSDVLEKYRQGRTIKAQTTHWIVAGSKDGKISLWNIY